MNGPPGLPLFGRAQVVADLADRIARADDGLGSLVLISGEAGMGKTALCEQVLAEAAGGGHRVAWVGCWQSAAVPALWPWSVVLARVAPEAGAVLGTVSASDPAATWFAQVDAVSRALAGEPDGRAAVVVIDDLHWADPASIDLLAQLATVVRTERVLVLATYRPEDAGPKTPLGERLPRLLRHAHQVPLAPLDDDAVSDIVTRGLGGTRLRAAARAELTRLARGNPLFVTELARLVAVSSADVGTAEFPVPPSVRDVVDARLTGVGTQCRSVLDRAAVIGDVVPLPLLATVCELSGEKTLTLLDEAIAASLVRDRGDHRFEFVHPLFRAAVYAGLTTSQRVALHAGIGLALERDRAAGAPVDPAALAHHFGRAAPAGTAAKAVRYAVDAAAEAMRIAGYATAASRYRQAIAAAEIAPEAGDRVALLRKLGEAQAASGDARAARESFMNAADLARRAGRTDELARAALGLSGGTGIEVRIDDPEQIVLLEEAIAGLGDADPALSAWLSARLSVATTLTAPLERRSALADRAITLATDARDEAALAHALATQCDVIAGPAYASRREHSAQRIIELAQSRDDVALTLLGGRLLVEALLELGELSRAEQAVNAYARTSERLRDPRYTFYVPLWRGALALCRGDERSYANHHHDLGSLAQAAATPNATILRAVQDMCAGLDFGLAPVPAGFAEMETHIVSPDLYGTVFDAYLRHAAGHDDEAGSVLASIAPALETMPLDSEWLPAMVQGAEMAAVLTDASARWAYQALLPFAQVWAVEGIGAAVRGPTERVLGILAARLGDRAAATGHFDRAVAACTRAGARPWVERTERDAERSLGKRTAPLPAPPASGLLRREGDMWFVDFAGRTARIRDSKGVRDLSTLLAGPEQEIAALDLVTRGEPTVLAEPAGPAIDATARAAYRHRLRDIEEELDDADAAGASARSARLLAEREAIAAELTGAYGLGGRARRTGSSAERARTAVTNRIRDAISRMRPVHPELAQHLSRAVRTGTFCRYSPDPAVRWEVTSPRG